MRAPRDRSESVNAVSEKTWVKQNDFCDQFIQDPGRLFSSKECWYCRYGDFKIFTEHPTERGICKYKEKSE